MPSPPSTRPGAFKASTIRTDAAYQRRWWTLAAMCLSLVLVAMDNTILNVAIPTLGRDLPADRSELQWIVDGYILVFAGLLLVGGSLGDRYGRRRFLCAGLAVFGVGSVAAAYSSTAGSLIAARGLMGAAAAMIMPATLSIITATFRDPTERAKAIGVWSGVSGLGIALGPVAGGWLIEHFWWGSAFLINLPVIAVALVAAPLVVPESRDETQRPIDVVGALLSVVAMTATLWTVIEAPEHGWTDHHTLAGFGVSFVLLALFVGWERHTPEPLLPMRFFANPRFSAASIAIALAFFALLGSMFLITQYMQVVAGYTALESGIRYVPLALTLCIVAPVGPRLVERVGTKLVVTAGLATAAAGLALLVRLEPGSTFTPLLVSQVVMALGLGLSLAPATEAIMGSLPPDQAGVGSAVNDTTRELGAALGVAVLGSLFASHYSNQLGPDVGTLPVEARTLALDSVAGAQTAARAIGGDAGVELQQLAAQAFTDGLHVAALAAAVMALAGAAIVAAFLPARAPEPSTTTTDRDLDPRLRADEARRLHIALGVEDVERSILDYSRRIGFEPSLVVPETYALWRDEHLNLSIRAGAPTGLRHLGWEDPAAEAFTVETDINGLHWEQFRLDQQLDEIRATWPSTRPV